MVKEGDIPVETAPADKVLEAYERLWEAKQSGVGRTELERIYSDELSKLSDEDQKKFESNALVQATRKGVVDHQVSGSHDENDDEGVGEGRRGRLPAVPRSPDDLRAVQDKLRSDLAAAKAKNPSVDDAAIGADIESLKEGKHWKWLEKKIEIEQESVARSEAPPQVAVEPARPAPDQPVAANSETEEITRIKADWNKEVDRLERFFSKTQPDEAVMREVQALRVRVNDLKSRDVREIRVEEKRLAAIMKERKESASSSPAAPAALPEKKTLGDLNEAEQAELDALMALSEIDAAQLDRMKALALKGKVDLNGKATGSSSAAGFGKERREGSRRITRVPEGVLIEEPGKEPRIVPHEPGFSGGPLAGGDAPGTRISEPEDARELPQYWQEEQRGAMRHQITLDQRRAAQAKRSRKPGSQIEPAPTPGERNIALHAFSEKKTIVVNPATGETQEIYDVEFSVNGGETQQRFIDAETYEDFMRPGDVSREDFIRHVLKREDRERGTLPLGDASAHIPPAVRYEPELIVGAGEVVNEVRPDGMTDRTYRYPINRDGEQSTIDLDADEVDGFLATPGTDIKQFIQRILSQSPENRPRPDGGPRILPADRPQLGKVRLGEDDRIGSQGRNVWSRTPERLPTEQKGIFRRLASRMWRGITRDDTNRPGLLDIRFFEKNSRPEFVPTLNQQLELALRRHDRGSITHTALLALKERGIQEQREAYKRNYKIFTFENMKGAEFPAAIAFGMAFGAGAVLSGGLSIPVLATAVAAAWGANTTTQLRNYLTKHNARGSVVVPAFWSVAWGSLVTYGLVGMMSNTPDVVPDRPSRGPGTLSPLPERVTPGGPPPSITPDGVVSPPRPVPWTVINPDAVPTPAPDVAPTPEVSPRSESPRVRRTPGTSDIPERTGGRPRTGIGSGPGEYRELTGPAPKFGTQEWQEWRDRNFNP